MVLFRVAEKTVFHLLIDLVRSLHPVPNNLTIEFVSAASYGKGTETSGNVSVSFNKEVVVGRNVLLVSGVSHYGSTKCQT
jgi:hypoxanthine-guanine phosphoribosyltransferase